MLPTPAPARLFVRLLGSVVATTLPIGTATAQQRSRSSTDPGQTASSIQTVTNDDGSIVVTAPRYVPQGSLSATKTAQPLIATSQSVSVITRDQIDLLDFVDAQQAVRYTAGVYGENYGPDPRYDFFTVRGFTPKQYIDGLAAPVSSSISSVGVDLYGFESLDLLKGPSSTLYGNTPPGGIYNETSRRASSAFGGEARVQYGTDNFKEMAGTVTGPVSRNLDVRVTGLYRDNDLVADHTRDQRVYIAPTATWRLGDATTLTALGYYQYDFDQGGRGGFLPVQGTLLSNPNGRIGQRRNLGDPHDEFERRQYAIGYEFVHRFGDGPTFTSNLKYNSYRERTPTGIYAGSFTNTTHPALPGYLRTVQQYNFSYAEDVHSIATDNRLVAKLDTGAISHTLLVGADYRAVHNTAAFGFVFAGTVDAFAPTYTSAATGFEPGYSTRYNDQHLYQTGLYGQEQAQLGQLYLTLGGRYDLVRDHYLAPDPASTAQSRASQEKFTWRAGANYVLASGIAPYLSYSTSFEPVLGTDAVTGDLYKPTTGRQWEGGVKFDARGLPSWIKLFATAAAFDIRQKNVVTTLAALTPVSGTQSGEVEVYGGEAELVARIRDQLTVNASYSYNCSRVVASNVAAEKGAPLPTTPRNKASVFVNYQLQRGFLKGAGLGLGGRYTSSSAGSLPGTSNPVVYYGQATTLMDAIVSYEVPGWRFAVNGSNVLDNRYVARCSGPVGCFYGAPRQVLATVTKRF